MPKPESLAKVRKFVTSYVAKGPFRLYPNAGVVENVIVGLADNLDAHGKMYCPCMPVDEAKARGSEMVCPCTPHAADIARQGFCDCALFASAEYAARGEGER